jgi:peptidoglycan/xylan/chitin deacetylase (PgdA/CDA1 family)
LKPGSRVIRRIAAGRGRTRLIAAILAIGWAAAAGAPVPAGASSAQREPLQVRAASLVQQGQQLVWHVELTVPFSPGALAADGRSLCLRIDQAATRSVAGQLCLSGPGRNSSSPRLFFMPIAPADAGAAHVIGATVTRSSDRDLTATFLPADVGVSYSPLRWQVISTACVTPSPAGCAEVYPSAPELLRLHEPQLVGCVAGGPTWVFHGPTNVREIALTFDDGPWYDTGQFLDVLEREHVVATFFQVGEHISQYAQHGLDRRMLKDGDMIGDHTWNHRVVAAGGSGAVTEISEAAAAIRRASGGFQPCLFRAPGGIVSPALLSTARSLGFTTIAWDVDPRDWATPGTTSIFDNVVRNAHDGAIVIQHDGGGNRSETLEALPLEIRTLRSEGYRFVTVTDLLGYRLLYR